MNILNKLFNKRQQLESSDNFKVIIKTDKNLSEKQKNAIINIIKEGVALDLDNGDIAIRIMMTTQIFEPVIMNKTDNSIEVIF